jgi:hypothetical protein
MPRPAQDPVSPAQATIKRIDAEHLHALTTGDAPVQRADRHPVRNRKKDPHPSSRYCFVERF